MKKIASAIVLFLLSSRLYAQDCSAYLFMQKSKVIESTTFDEKGKPLRKSVSTVMDVTTVNGTTIGNVVAQAYNADGTTIGGKNNLTYKCNNGSFMVAMNPGTGGDKVDITGGYLEYPPGMKVGDHLKDAGMQLSMAMGGGKNTTASTKITDRLVAAKETVTTPAGTWTAFKITSKTVTTVGGNAIPPQTVLTTEWYVPNFGIIKTQFYGMNIEITKIH